MFNAKEWTDNFIQGPKRLLTGAESHLLISLLGLPKTAYAQIDADMGSELPLYSILKSRAAIIGADIDPAAALLLCQIVEGNIGYGIMMLHALHMHLGSKITLDLMIEQAFPMGVPTTEHCSASWSAQKIGGGNAIDVAEYWEHK